jgi:histidine triad (HIT) family protein
MSADCIFCKIASGEIPARAVFRDENVIAIEDVNPQAPVHLLVMPLRHRANLGEIVEADETELVNGLIEVATRLGRERGGSDGFRIVVNTGPAGGQTVDHAHVHVLAGRAMHWPPG